MGKVGAKTSFSFLVLQFTGHLLQQVFAGIRVWLSNIFVGKNDNV